MCKSFAEASFDPLGSVSADRQAVVHTLQGDVLQAYATVHDSVKSSRNGQFHQARSGVLRESFRRSLHVASNLCFGPWHMYAMLQHLVRHARYASHGASDPIA